MLPDQVSNPGPLTYESGALPVALHGLAGLIQFHEFGLSTFSEGANSSLLLNL